MRRQDTASRELDLFDLPLVVDPGVASEIDREVAMGSRDDARRREPELEAEQIDLPAADGEPAPAAVERAERRVSTALLARRLQGGLLDTAVVLAALAVLILGASRLGAQAQAADWPAYLLPTLEFSFFYVVFSITFWGRTPGMARVGLTVSTMAGHEVTLGQAARRWLGGVMTLTLLGLPTLLALRGGRSLADRVSGGRTARA